MSGMTKAVFGQLRKKADAASYDSHVTRQRVDIIEKGMAQFYAIMTRPFLGRLKWLLLGR
jgi:hypothetical protein